MVVVGIYPTSFLFVGALAVRMVRVERVVLRTLTAGERRGAG
jgi:hypothetical protein